MTKAGQQEFVFRTWGGRRKGAGRKPRVLGRIGVPHATRPLHRATTPVHVTLRAVRLAPNLRLPVIFEVIDRELRAASRQGLRVVHFSVQSDHVHLIVEAMDHESLWRGLQRFESRVAMELNRVARRSGKLWRERYHRHDLATPSQVRNAYVYVLMNVRKHDFVNASILDHHLSTLDPRSSAPWFTGWHPEARPPPRELAASTLPSPVVAPRSWLAATGWRDCGLIRFDEMPRTRR